ncbi:MAG: UDP-N-acetylmuramyl-tripeptide synthetase [Spirochaetaceae bacterium]|nr:UDP-N-acetylmuramyl-tripeptide synthetase [Spirochaetaceae bacterium]
MKKFLSQIINDLQILSRRGDFDPEIESLCFDSRQVEKNSLFFALPGTHTTGNKFISQGIERGAVAIIFEGDLDFTPFEDVISQGKTVFLQVKSARKAMAPLSLAFFDFPAQEMTIYGVTGTEGKSSTVFFIWQLLRLAGKKAGFISTVEFSRGDDEEANPEHQTTPEATIVQAKLREMADNGCSHAVVESSSHGLSRELNRLGGIDFHAAAFMNVTHEHLEFHGTFEKYRDDKCNLFRALDSQGIAAVNLDDPSAEYFAENTDATVVGFATRLPKKVPGKIGKFLLIENLAENSFSPTSTVVSCDVSVRSRLWTDKNAPEDPNLFGETGNFRLEIPFAGTFNAYNVVAAMILISHREKISFRDLSVLAKQLRPVKGRMTEISMGQKFSVIVDYAHTPSSFEQIFPSVRKRCSGKLIALFGSAGERDVQKRFTQGKIAADYSDVVILTDEDPRGEDSMAILDMIAQGCAQSERAPKAGDNLFLIPNRVEAIEKAFSLAQAGDIVLLLGKGHENSIIGKDGALPYDEITAAKTALKKIVL